MQDVDRFAAQHDLQDVVHLLRKGALAAQRPLEFDQIEELDDEDKAFLLQERTHKWKHPRTLYFTIILNSIAAAIQGWDQEVTHSSLVVHHSILSITDTTRDPTVRTCPSPSLLVYPTVEPCAQLKEHVNATAGS